MSVHQQKFKPNATLPKGRELNGGDLLAQSLKHLGVEIAFGLHGGHLDAFLMGAHEIGIKLVDTRHETVAVQAAEGYNKITNEVGVCFVTANSGFCNGIPGLATAFADRSSVLCITSSSPQRDSEANVLQGFHDQIVLSAPITRFAHRIIHAEEIPRLVSYAWRRATASPPGPVLLDVPIEVLFSPVQTSRISWGSLGAPLAYPPGPNPEAVHKAAELLKNSARPIVVTGSGARKLGQDDEFANFVDATQIPVFASSKHSSPLRFGSKLRCGNVASLSARKSMERPPPDVVLILGARSGMFLGSRSEPSLPSAEGTKYIHVDIDSAELGRMIPVDTAEKLGYGRLQLQMQLVPMKLYRPRDTLGSSEMHGVMLWVQVKRTNLTVMHVSAARS
ncbi:hypothetical protein N0V82_010403 [Gnomoniopsis sp. IMI 355080]|nr:hypothetical protein N0V82_010403 [Gnomoniopsis sp. IMI 355080]